MDKETEKERGCPAGKWTGTDQFHLVLEGRMEMSGACRGAKFQEGRGELGGQKDFQSTSAAEKQEL